MVRNTPFFTIYLTNPKLIENLEKIKWREHKSQSQLGREAIEEYVKNHADGNDTFTLDQFQEPDFKACPAFFRNSETWWNHLLKLDEKQHKEFDNQLNMLLNLSNRRYQQF